jgi:hypothetical protein
VDGVNRRTKAMQEPRQPGASKARRRRSTGEREATRSAAPMQKGPAWPVPFELIELSKKSRSDF